jgi:hypothetical protein
MRNLTKALCVLALAALQACAANHNVTLDLSEHELTFAKSGDYDFIVLPGAATTTVVGAPALPALAVNVVIPQNMRVTGVKCTPVTTEDVEGSFLIMPVQPPRPISAEGEPKLVPPDPAVYNSDAPYPAELGKAAGQNSMKGYNVASLIVYPVQYNPANKTLKYHTKLSLDLTLEQADLGYLSVGNRSEETRTEIEKEIKSVVVNPDDVNRFAPKGQWQPTFDCE